ncbi:PR domain zinc finger protein 5-like isoform X2 [Galleria mellonella]|uniref:PR domain zinc finger protein 5-like isoform X2 n=1 Tax=Galleria mellonella TaxID=7137 RepID=A0ABM3MAB5_GALME|nr:PR domain zinc finger protein 5-like isoform X2 [Galleria mellonella]
MSHNFSIENVMKLCRACLTTGDNLRIMTYEETNTYKLILNEMNSSYEAIYTCQNCGFLLEKITKFVKQCQDASVLLKQHSYQDIKPNLVNDKSLYHFKCTPPVYHYIGPNWDLNDDDFDNDDVPLSNFLNGDVKKEKVRKKKRKKLKNEVTELEIEQEIPIKIEQELTESSQVADLDLSRENPMPVPAKPRRQKVVKEGFTSRMVQETDEYVVIKLTKEQVLQEMQERSKTVEYQRTLFKCEKCVKGFNFEDVLRSHMVKHSQENGTFLCEICTQYCPSVVSLRGHMKSHTTRYACKVCALRRGSRQHVLEHHALAHAARAALYACRRCAYTTHKRTVMQRHARSHGPREKLSCPRCGKLFLNVETLRVHTTRHDKSKRLQCEHCNRMFIYPSMLHQHIQAVHVRKDYYCVECDIKFKSRDNLRLHFKKAKRHRDASSYQQECGSCPRRTRGPAAAGGGHRGGRPADARLDSPDTHAATYTCTAARTHSSQKDDNYTVPNRQDTEE